MKLLLALFCCAILLNTSAQSDLMVLKKRNHVVQTWVKGSFIDFQFSSRQWIQGYIKDILHDSLIIDQFVINKVPGPLGFARFDTARMGPFKLHIKEIYGLPKRTYGSSIISSGALFQLGGGAYIFLNIFNSLTKKEPVFGSRNLTGIGIAAGVFLFGKILEWSHQPFVVIGKKYRLETITSSVSK